MNAISVSLPPKETQKSLPTDKKDKTHKSEKTSPFEEIMSGNSESKRADNSENKPVDQESEKVQEGSINDATSEAKEENPLTPESISVDAVFINIRENSEEGVQKSTPADLNMKEKNTAVKSSAISNEMVFAIKNGENSHSYEAKHSHLISKLKKSEVSDYTSGKNNNNSNSSEKQGLNTEKAPNEIQRKLNIQNKLSVNTEATQDINKIDDPENILKSIKIGNEEYYSEKKKNAQFRSINDNIETNFSKNGHISTSNGESNQQFDLNKDNVEKNIQKIIDLAGKISNANQSSSKTSNIDKSADIRNLMNFTPDRLPEFTAKLVKNTNTNNSSAAKLLLKPPSLGTVFVEIRVSDSLTKVNILADSKEAYKLLKGQQLILKEKLIEQGLKPENINIDIREERSEEQIAQDRRNTNEKKNSKREFLDYFKDLRELVKNFSIG